MEKEEQARVRATVEEILAEVNIEEVSAKQVRDMAAQRTGLDLSSREGKKFVSSVIKKALDSAADASYAEAGAPNPKVPVEREEPEVEEDSRDRCSKKMKVSEDVKEDEDIHDQVYEEDAEEASREGDKPIYEKDEEGNIIICELSAKRKVVVSQFRGKTLISVREYYERDGKVLPSAKGISLTAEQFQVLAKSAKDVEAAISSLQ
ncbi:RNA polymerase II transcriptional coactivator KELP [Physcomitrium patens]|uniref:DEK-C domain-containing protein n=1 Tax=Physcomitrium patens TaxID=3218 RepID=A0A2K1IAX0_PHYPA|nr:RNA polymerase II transcriptional coactivator KELP-like [Physcomitrium patens]PNR26414.1 hypothetical protein PHYPA_030989 [Physcomitrium patens]|eukprot:XP_024367313.1 RNA polymerase II transcriptional coactivator KELP-like [Physcomitrella patens]